MINPSTIYNVYNVHVLLILSIKGIRFILSSEDILQAHNYASKSIWLNWRHFLMLFLLTNSLPSVLMLDKIWLEIFKTVCFSEYMLCCTISVCFIHAWYQNVYKGYFGKCATQFHHPVKVLWIVFIIPVCTYNFLQ